MTKPAKIPRANFTAIPNLILDSINELSHIELRLILFLCRRTFGWHKKQTVLTRQQIMEGTGIGNGRLRTAIDCLINKGWIKRNRYLSSFAYALNYEETAEEKPTDTPSSGSEPPLPDRNAGSSQVEPPHIDNKENKENAAPIGDCSSSSNKNRTAEDEIKVPTRELMKRWEEERKVLGYGYVPVVYGREAKAAKQLLTATKKTIDQLLLMAREAWKHDSFNCRRAMTIHGFAEAYNEIRHELNTWAKGIDPQRPKQTQIEETREELHKLDELLMTGEYTAETRPKIEAQITACKQRIAILQGKQA